MRSKMIIDEYGTKNWELTNVALHRVDGPYAIGEFEKQWCIND
jgi:hypothetical protein